MITPVAVSVADAEMRTADPRILILAQSGLTLKNIFYGSLLPALEGQAEVCVSTDYHDDAQLRSLAAQSRTMLAPFPCVDARKDRMTGRLEGFLVSCWDCRGVSQTRSSKRRLAPSVKPRNFLHAGLRAASKLAQTALAKTRLLEQLDRIVEERLQNEQFSPSALAQLSEWRPDIVLSTAPHRPSDLSIARAARRLGIPVVAWVNSWDNLTGKDRITFTYDGYLLWSEQMKIELHMLYERARQKPYWIVGAPNFDTHFEARWHLTREAFCHSLGLDPARSIVFYGTGSRGLAPEYVICERLAQAIRGGQLADAQLLVRLHPLNDDPNYDALAKHFPEVVVRQPGRTNLGMLPGSPSTTTGGIIELVNSLRHADVVINLASTLTIDAAIFDRPVINVAYDPIAVPPEKSRIKDIYTVYDHYQPIVNSGGVRLAGSEAELLQEIKRYLLDPALEQSGRRRIVELEVGLTDGRAGARIAKRVLELATASGSEPSAE